MDSPGDWCGAVTDLDQVRALFPQVMFHKCLCDALHYGIPQANAIAYDDGRSPPRPTDHEPTSGSQQRGGHPYGRP